MLGTKTVLEYVFLPKVLPRMRDLFSVTFSHAAYFVALIFEAVRLLPAHHPYLKSDFFGQYSVSMVLRQAYKRLTFDRRHLDQILIFFTMILGIFVFFAQIIILAFSVFFPFAWAGLANPPQFDNTTMTLESIVGTEFPEDDIAFMLLDRVFGVDDMFNSRYDPAGIGVGGFPYPYHFGLQALFQTFSVAMLAVGLLILTYFVITILAETVRDGTAFGKRFNRVWAPIRLVMAFGLLVPMANGLNAAQYIVLISAKWGSGFATNGLTYFYGEIHNQGSTPFGEPEYLIATPNTPDPKDLLHFMITARACQYATQFYETYNEGFMPPAIPVGVTTPISGYYIIEGAAGPEPNLLPGFEHDASGGALTGAPSAGALDTYMVDTGYESINIVFGHESDAYSGSYANVFPFCGAVTMPIVSPDNPMAVDVQEYFLRIMAAMWKDQEIIDAAAQLAASKLPAGHACNTTDYPGSSCPPGEPPNMTEFKARKVDEYKELLRVTAIGSVINDYVGGAYDADFEWCGPEPDPYLLSYGWAGAAICYNKIAQYNGSITAAAQSIPMPDNWPKHLEYVQQKRQEAGLNINAIDRFNPILTGENDNLDIWEGNSRRRHTAEASYEAYRQWVASGQGTGDGGTPSLSGINIKDIINIIFGTEGIFNMTKPENRDVHPLALLSSAGRGLIEASIRNIGFAGIGLGAAMVTEIGALGSISASFMLSFATISMVAGFILFYVIPLLPFLYFFFAVAGWVKGIFEAMVGVPLWALAHMRIDGDGIPGNAAMSGYLLILEIFLRPILIIFGLLASSLIFAALAKVLNELWSLVVENLTGFDQKEAEDAGYPITSIEYWRSPIDEFFYTIIYTIIIYMIATASFKLIDLIPNFILRWAGQSVEAFGETLGDPAAQLSQKATVGFSATSSKMMGGVEQFGSASQSVQGYQAAKRAGDAAG